MVAANDLVLNEMFPNPARPATTGDGEPQEIKTADELAGDAVKLLRQSPLYPNLQYVALCHRAAVLRACAKWARQQADEALAVSDQAVGLLENPRLSLSEGDIGRAEFLSQYTQAFDQLIEWHGGAPRGSRPWSAPNCAATGACSTGSVPTATRPADRLRSQLYRAAEQAFQDSTRLARELKRLDDAATSDRPADADAAKKKLKEDFGKAQNHYEELQREILAKTPAGQAGFGRVLSRSDVEKVIKDRVLSRNDLAIYYHVGVSNSYLFVLGLAPPTLG